MKTSNGWNDPPWLNVMARIISFILVNGLFFVVSTVSYTLLIKGFIWLFVFTFSPFSKDVTPLNGLIGWQTALGFGIFGGFLTFLSVQLEKLSKKK